MKKRFKLVPYQSIKDEIQVTAVLKKRGPRLFLEYKIRDPFNKVQISNHSKDVRKEGLWNETCFEFFIKQPSTGEYLEFHFAPQSGAWNVIHFNSYRKRSVEQFPWKNFKGLPNRRGFEIDLNMIEQILGPGPYQCGMTTVIKTQNEISYFALQHSDVMANFHHPASFIETLKV